MARKTLTSPLASSLAEAQTYAEAGKYSRALKAARQAKTDDPANVYILAFERQLEQLLELSQQDNLTDENKLDILESLPGISERAIGSGALQNNEASAPEPEGNEKTAALEWLKNQYFQHAHDYVRKGEYQHALTEIRRVYIIEPDNKVAPQFEQQIVELSSLRELRDDAKPGTDLLTPAMDSPERNPKAPTAGKSRTRLLVAIVVFLLAVAAAALYFWSRQNSRPHSSPQAPTSSHPLTPSSPGSGHDTPSPMHNATS